MTPSQECTDCGASFVPDDTDGAECLASCCASVRPNRICPQCRGRHFAQFFLDACGAFDGYFGPKHPEVVGLMARFRAYH